MTPDEELSSLLELLQAEAERRALAGELRIAGLLATSRLTIRALATAIDALQSQAARLQGESER